MMRLARLVLACASVATAASAHAPPQANGIFWTQAEGGGEARALVRTNRGLISEDADGKFRILCNDAYAAALSEVPPVAEASGGRLLLGTYERGLVLSTPDRCSFEPVEGTFAGFYPIDVEVDSRGVVYAAALPLDGSSAELLASSEPETNGESLAELPGAPTALELAPSDESRIYVSVTTAEGNLSFGSLLTSTDSGRSFHEHAIELDASELRAFLLAVAPDDPQLTFVRTQSRDGVTPERLLRSDDGGETFETVLSAPGPLSALVEPSGVVWVGGAEGLHRSEDEGRTFTLAEGADLTRVSCLAARGGALYACAYSEGEFGVLVSKDAGESFEWFLRFPQVTARLDCPAESDERALCDFAFADWSMEQAIEPPASGGDAGAPAVAPLEPQRRGSSAGCRLGARTPERQSFALLGAALGLLALRRFRR